MRIQTQSEVETCLLNFLTHDMLYTIQFQYNRFKLRRIMVSSHAHGLTMTEKKSYAGIRNGLWQIYLYTLINFSVRFPTKNNVRDLSPNILQFLNTTP
jgi:hypothetical protein